MPLSMMWVYLMRVNALKQALASYLMLLILWFACMGGFFSEFTWSIVSLLLIERSGASSCIAFNLLLRRFEDIKVSKSQVCNKVNK